MRFLTRDDDLSLGLELDAEPAGVDLTEPQEDGRTLGDQILDAAVEGMIAAVARHRAPDGGAWPELAAATVRPKGHGALGDRSGRTHLLDPDRWTSGSRTVAPRWLGWWLDCDDCLGNDRNRCPARRLVGWTDDARQFARERLAAAAFRADAAG